MHEKVATETETTTMAILQSEWGGWQGYRWRVVQVGRPLLFPQRSPTRGKESGIAVLATLLLATPPLPVTSYSCSLSISNSECNPCPAYADQASVLKEEPFSCQPTRPFPRLAAGQEQWQGLGQGQHQP